MDRVIGDMEAQLLCSLFEAACFLTRLPVWNDWNPVKRLWLEDLTPAKTGEGGLRRLESF